MSTPEDKFRKLTTGEIIFCKMLFESSIDYSRVKIFNGKWMPMQSESVVMTPNGNLYYPKKLFQEDFSINSSSGIFNEGLPTFMHEMVHVWQYQHGYGVKIHGVCSFYTPRYRYALSKDKTLADYNLEAQANLLADYFLLLKFKNLGAHRLLEKDYRGENYLHLIAQYNAVLSNFISNPHDKSNLPDVGWCGLKSGNRILPRRRENHK